MSKQPKPGSRLVTILFRRDDLAALAAVMEKPAVKDAMGLRPDNGGAEHMGPGTTGGTLRRAFNLIAEAESKARAIDSRLAQEALREKEERAQKAKRAREERRAQRLARLQGNG